MEALTLQGAKRREGKWKKKGLIPWAGQGQCKRDTNEEASLQWESTTEGSSLVSVARPGSNLLSLHINTHTQERNMSTNSKGTHRNPPTHTPQL